MRCLERNKTKLHYSLYLGATPNVDEYGNETGESSPAYSNPVAINANVSAARGSADVDQFGISMNYDKAIITDDVNCPICETSILWIDAPPVIARDGTTETPHDYVVTRVAKSLNNVLYAVRKVEVS